MRLFRHVSVDASGERAINLRCQGVREVIDPSMETINEPVASPCVYVIVLSRSIHTHEGSSVKGIPRT